MIDLAKEIEKYYYDNFAFISRAHTPTLEILRSIATHFYEIGQIDAANKYDEIEYNRQRAEEEMLNKDLNEAADEYAYNVYPSEGVANIEICEAFKAGAQWKEAQMLRKAVKGYVGVHLHDKRADVTVNSGYLPESMGIKGDSEVYLVVLKVMGENK